MQHRTSNGPGARTGTQTRHRRRWVTATAGAVVVALGVLALSGCSGGGSGSSAQLDQAPVPQGRQAGESTGDVKAAPAGAAPGDTTTTLVDGITPAGRALVTQASLAVEVADVEQARTQVLAVANGNGGYVASEQTSSDPQGAAPSTTSVIVVRVPQPRSSVVIDRLQQLGTVTSLDQSTTDVTTKVADVDARVRSAEASVRRIRALLASASTIGQVVAIEGQLSQRQADLESLQAQQRALADATTDATITVSLTSRSTVVAPAPGTGFLAGLRQGWDAFTAVVSGALTGLGWLLPFVTFLAVVGLLLLGAVRLARRRATHLT